MIRIHPLGARGAMLRSLAVARAAEAPRTGVHVSSLIDNMLRQLGEYADPLPADVLLTFQELGNTYEDLVAEQLLKRYRQGGKPIEFQFHGILGNADWWNPATSTVHEMKATWKSPKGFSDTLKFQAYLWQGLFYADALHAARLSLHIWHVVGTGRPPFPQADSTLIVTYDQADLDANTARLVQHGKDLGWL